MVDGESHYEFLMNYCQNVICILLNLSAVLVNLSKIATHFAIMQFYKHPHLLGKHVCTLSAVVLEQGAQFECRVLIAATEMSSDSLERAEVQAAMDSMPATGKPTYLAARQIALWKKQGEISGDNDTLVRLYLALRSVKGDGYRITARDFSHWEHTLSKSSTIKRSLFLVQKSNLTAAELEVAL